MRLEFGKWLMDVAKYMLTALLLANVFGNMDSLGAIWLVIFLVIAILGLGLFFIYKSESDQKEVKLQNDKKRKGK